MTQVPWKERALEQLRGEFHPSKFDLVHVTKPFGKNLNTFSGVEMRAAVMYGTGSYNKHAPVFAMLEQGIINEVIREGTPVFAASSGQTGFKLAEMCRPLGLRCWTIMKADTITAKSSRVAMQRGLAKVLLTSESTQVEAEQLAIALDGFNTNQYKNPANALGHRDYTAAQLFAPQNGYFDIVFVPCGTMGTARGIKWYADAHGLATKVIPVVCEDGQEIPAARTVASIKEVVGEDALDEFGPPIKIGRRAAFVAAAALGEKLRQLDVGPTGSMTYAGALKFLAEHWHEFDQSRILRVGIMFPDAMTLYQEVAKTALHGVEDFEIRDISVERIIEVINAGK